jgi:hypothetical protein
VHLFDAWTALSLLDLVRLLGPPAAVLVAAIVPGRRVAAVAAIACAIGAGALDELSAPGMVRAGWVALWLWVAWQAGSVGHEPRRRPGVRRGAIESGAVALPLGVGMLLLLLAALSRQGLPAADELRAPLGAIYVGFGLLHLMLRRHVRRALVAFAALGLGLELLAAAARNGDVLHAGAPAGAALAGAVIVVTLTRRIAESRERFASSPDIGDAHGLHD